MFMRKKKTMERGYRDIGRSSLAGADYDDYRSYSRQGRGLLTEYESTLRDSYMGSPGSSSYRSGRSSYGGRSGSFDGDIMDTLVQQRALQQQLSLRESQLALANSLLQQQQQQQQYMTKRRMDPRAGDPRQDFKRPRMMDMRSRPRNRLTGGSSAGVRRRGSRGSANLRNRKPSEGRGRSSSEQSTSKDKYDPEKPTTDEEGEKGKLRCKPCNIQFKDEEELKKHLSTSEHKQLIASTVCTDSKSSADKESKQFCNVCDVTVNTSMQHHLRLTFHKKRKIQVTKGCGWCGVTSFKNFSEVLEHRSTEKHVKNQELHDKQRDARRSGDHRRDSRGGSRSQREREPIRVQLPPELTKFDPKVVTGQGCVIAVTGWFCKLCNKFYNNETAAKETHCMTEPHFNNYKKFMYTKLKAKAEAERDAKEKAAEEERKKKEAEEKAAAEEKKKEEAEKEASSSEQAKEGPGDGGEGKEQESGEEMEQNGVPGEEEETAGEGQEEGEEDVAEGEEETAMEEDDGVEMIGEPEEYVDEEEASAAEDSLLALPEEGGEEQTGTGDADAAEGNDQEEQAQMKEEAMEADQGEEEEEEATAEASTPKKATRAATSSPGRGRGRGAGANRARRGRRVAK